MQNNEYYEAYVREWRKALKQQPKVTAEERQELHELLERQKEEQKKDVH